MDNLPIVRYETNRIPLHRLGEVSFPPFEEPAQKSESIMEKLNAESMRVLGRPLML